MKKRIAAARLAAFGVLEQVAAGGYASDLLREATRNLSARDAGLAGQLVLGSLRVQNQLDYLIEKYSGRPAGSLDLAVQMALRLAIYQIRYLERIPPHAAVDDSVEFVKTHKRAASGLTNAVLRKANRDIVDWPNEALRYACPAWLLDRWKAHFGPELAIGIAAAALKEPEPFIRIRPGESVPEGVETEPTEIPGCFRLLSPVGECVRLHDISSQAIVPLLGLQSSHSYLDLCSAPGNKTAQAMESQPELAIACDISERRLRTVERLANRVVLDASEQLPFGRKFDRILIDAPCSGTGTLGRNPEIKWRLSRAELTRQHARQVNILKRAAAVLSPGGQILYVTCSLEIEENEAVIGEAAAAHSNLKVETEMWRLPGRDSGDGFYAALLVKTGSFG
jgi:16S rRNA (cytosine967-C5)-methyltransferase